MAKLYFHYAAMNAGKSAHLLQANHNYTSGGMRTLLLRPDVDTRAPAREISSRIGLAAEATPFTPHDNLYTLIAQVLSTGNIACIFVDEAQFMTERQIRDLARVVDMLKIPVMCYGLRTDFLGKLFPGSEALMRFADEIREIRSICHCGCRATMVARLDAHGNAMTDGDQVAIEGENATYVSLCRKHWAEKTGL